MSVPPLVGVVVELSSSVDNVDPNGVDPVCFVVDPFKVVPVTVPRETPGVEVSVRTLVPKVVVPDSVVAAVVVFLSCCGSLVGVVSVELCSGVVEPNDVFGSLVVDDSGNSLDNVDSVGWVGSVGVPSLSVVVEIPTDELTVDVPVSFETVCSVTVDPVPVFVEGVIFVPVLGEVSVDSTVVPVL